MAIENTEGSIALNVVVKTDKANLSLGELEDGFDALQTQLKKTNRGTEEGRKQFKELSGQMALASKEIKNIELGFEGLDSEGVASEFGGLAGGIGDVTASLVLMGGENETIEQMGRSIEKAMAISMGFKGVIEGTQAGLKLYNNVVKNSTLFQKLNNATTIIAAAVMKLFKGSVDATSKSFKTLKTAIAATGIGLLVVGVAALVANFGKIKDAINGVSAATKDLVASNVLNTEASKGNLEAINGSNNLLRQQGKTEKEILQIKLIANKAHLEDLEADLEGNKKLNKEKVEGAKWLQETLLQTLEILFFIPRTILKLVDLVTKTFADMINDITQDPIMKKVLGLEPVNFDFGIAEGADDLLDQATRLIFDPEAVDEAGKAEQKILEDNLLKQKETIAGHELSLEAIGKKGLEAKNKTIDEQNAKEKADAEALVAFNEEQSRIKIQLIQDEGERKRAEIEHNSQLELEALEKSGLWTMNAEMLILQEKSKALAEVTKAEDDKRFAAEQEAQAKRDEYDKLLFDAKIANEQEETERQRLQIEEDYQNNLDALEEQGLLTMALEIELLYTKEQALADIKEEFAEKERQGRLALNQERLESATQVIGAIGSLNSAALATDLKNAGDNEALKEKLRKASFEREKKLNIAMALVNGAQAQMSILAQTPKADFGIATAIAMGAAAITTIAQIAAIKATTYQGGGSVATSPSAEVSAGGAGNAGGGAQITPVSNTSTILGNQQVFVTETDITSTQNNVSVIEESATF